jgi:hypothetical protein
MKRKIILLFLALWCGALWCESGMAQTGWELKKDKDGIKVYSRTNSHSKFNELRVETTWSGRLSDLAAVILDIPAYPNWSFNCKSSQVLKRISPSDLYIYTEINSPWPAANRDLPIHIHITQEPSTKVMTIKVECVPDYIPHKKDIVRVPLSKETWTVKAIDKNTIHIDYQLEVDPGENAPAWLVNMFSVKGPFETFVRLKDQIHQAKYHNTPIPFISN